MPRRRRQPPQPAALPRGEPPAGPLNSLTQLLRTAPGFACRVIFGMCGVICYDKNQFLDPGVDHLELHPDVRAGLDLLAQQRADFFPRLERDARAALAETVERAAARHIQEMRIEQRSRVL